MLIFQVEILDTTSQIQAAMYCKYKVRRTIRMELYSALCISLRRSALHVCGNWKAESRAFVYASLADTVRDYRYSLLRLVRQGPGLTRLIRHPVHAIVVVVFSPPNNL
jgi:hypothetical protein